MKLLFSLDKNDYQGCTHTFVRNSARAVIIKDKRIAMVHSLKNDYYKFPGGEIKADENPVSAMIRETREESGLVVLPDTIKEYGYVHRIQKNEMDQTECFVQDNFYYLCEVENNVISQNLDDYEAEEDYVLEFVNPGIAIEKNRSENVSDKNKIMLEREARVLELLICEGYFD